MPTALVIGGRRGIGAAVVNALAEAGFDITYTTRTNDPAHHEALTTRHPTRTFITHNLDLANRDSVESFATEIEDAPPYAALIHVAGTTYDSLAAMMDQATAETLMQVNFWSFTRLARAVIRPMTRARAGRIIAIGSVVGAQASQGNAAYGASKAAQIALASSWQAETQRIGPRVVIASPQPMPTATRARFFPGENRSALSAPRTEADRILRDILPSA